MMVKTVEEWREWHKQNGPFDMPPIALSEDGHATDRTDFQNYISSISKYPSCLQGLSLKSPHPDDLRHFFVTFQRKNSFITKSRFTLLLNIQALDQTTAEALADAIRNCHTLGTLWLSIDNSAAAATVLEPEGIAEAILWNTILDAIADSPSISSFRFDNIPKEIEDSLKIQFPDVARQNCNLTSIQYQDHEWQAAECLCEEDYDCGCQLDNAITAQLKVNHQARTLRKDFFKTDVIPNITDLQLAEAFIRVSLNKIHVLDSLPEAYRYRASLAEASVKYNAIVTYALDAPVSDRLKQALIDEQLTRLKARVTKLMQKNADPDSCGIWEYKERKKKIRRAQSKIQALNMRKFVLMVEHEHSDHRSSDLFAQFKRTTGLPGSAQEGSHLAEQFESNTSTLLMLTELVQAQQTRIQTLQKIITKPEKYQNYYGEYQFDDIEKAHKRRGTRDDIYSRLTGSSRLFSTLDDEGSDPKSEVISDNPASTKRARS